MVVMYFSTVCGPCVLGDLADVETHDGPALGPQQFDEVIAPGQAANLRIGTAAGLDVAVHLAANDDDQIGLGPADKKRVRRCIFLARFFYLAGFTVGGNGRK